MKIISHVLRMVIIISISLLGSTLTRAADDTVKEFEALKQSAEKGDAKAQFELGLKYYKGDIPTQDKAASQPLPGVMPTLPRISPYGEYTHPLGIPSFRLAKELAPNVKNRIEAAKWLKKAAEKDIPEAQFYLGLIYLEGVGVVRDVDEGISLIRKAAEQGYLEAQFFLAMKYYHGEIVGKNYKEAAKWLIKLAEKGVIEAEDLLGRMYFEGQGVDKDLVQAHIWLNVAGASGNGASRQLLPQVEAQMTHEDIAKATKLARGLFEKLNKGN